MNTIVSHVFKQGYNNNAGYFATNTNTDKSAEMNGVVLGRGIKIKGVSFVDFSYSNQKPSRAVNYSIMNLIHNNSLVNALNNGTLDVCNKMISMMWINWNGAIIKKGNFANGEDVIVSDTPEFLAIFNNISEAVYDNIIVEQNITDKIGLFLFNAIQQSSSVVINSTNRAIKDNENMTLIIENTGNAPITITVNNNASVADLDNVMTNCVFKVPNPAGLSISIPVGGYGELNFLRKGNFIYTRGV